MGSRLEVAMATSAYRRAAAAWQKPRESGLQAVIKERAVAWRAEPTVSRVERPTKLHRARELGYKAKRGFIVVRVRVRKGSGEKLKPMAGRRPKAMGLKKIKPGKGKRLIAVGRAAKRFPNLTVLNSYPLWEDGRYKWFEVIMVDPSHPSVRADGELMHRLGLEA